MSAYELLMAGVLRAGTSLLLAGPTLLAGVIVAGLLRRAHAGAWLDARAWRAIAVACAAPLCALGVIPVLVELFRQRARPRTILAFVLLGGAINPLSLTWAFSQMPATWVLIWIALSLLTATVTLLLCDYLCNRGAKIACTNDDAVSVQASDDSNVFSCASQCLFNRLTLFAICISLAFAGAVAVALPGDFLSSQLVERSAWNWPLLTAVALGGYVNPDLAVMQSQQIVDLGATPGVSFVWFALAPAICVGVLLVTFRAFGLRRFVVSMTVYLMLITLASVALDRTTFTGRIAPEDTHAFDPVSRPYHMGEDGSGALASMGKQLQKKGDQTSVASLVILCVLPVLGRLKLSGGRAVHRRGWVIAGCGAIVVTGGVIVYAYFPAPHWTFMDVRRTMPLIVSAANRHERATSELDQLHVMLRRVRVGAWIRPWTLSSASRQAHHDATNAWANADACRDNPAEFKSAAIELARAVRDAERAYDGRPNPSR